MSLLKLIWLVPLLPLIGAAVNLFMGKRLGKAAGVLASLLMGIAFLFALVELSQLLKLPATDRVVLRTLFDWIHVGSLHVLADLRLDPLSMTMILVVTGVGFLIHVYANGYMHGDPRFGRFFAYMNLFVFFMLVLVLANNLLLLYFGWEGVGLCSFLLVGFWFDRPKAAAAAKKAFIVTRIGDTLMLIGIILTWVHFGSLDFTKILGPAAGSVTTAVALLLFAGAVGKSAQLPLHIWLPDAMEGPTPVSALIHAATMVTAGVYLVVRTHALFTPEALFVVAIIGLATALYAATAALGQDDIKRVLAYSTISQLGYMFFAAGLKDYSAAIFMLVAHAFYKGLMFLSAGSVMHGIDGKETDMNKMGGLRKFMPITSTAFIIGALAISGIPPLVGFFAKDPIIAFADETGHTIMWILAVGAAFLSALYISRLIFITFFGSYRGTEHPHESPKVMTIPMMVLSALAIFGGVLGLSSTTGAIERFLQPVTGQLPRATQGLPDYTLTAIGIASAVLGIAVAWFIYGSGRIDWLALRSRYLPLHRFLEHGWYIDDAYATIIGAPAMVGAAFLAYVVDSRWIDGFFNNIGRWTISLAAVGRRVQTGLVRTYALVFLVGAFGVVFYLVAVR
jgi:NADH-quinone oxidoreductase subunit L